MVNHGLSTGALFLVVGMLIARGGSRMIADYGGVQKVAPMLAGLFLVDRAVLAGAARACRRSSASSWCCWARSPGTRRYAIIATAGIILAALYILLLVQRTMHGPPRGLADPAGSVTWPAARCGRSRR